MPPTPINEKQRLSALESYKILDTLPEQAYDDIARLAACICGVDRAMIAFIDKNRKWHKARFNVKAREMPRDYVICAHTIMNTIPLIVNDAQSDNRVSDIGIVCGPPYVRFYAGVPLITDDGLILGTLCAVDTEPHSITQSQIDSLEALGRQVIQLLNLRKNIMSLEKAEKRLQQQHQDLNDNNQALHTLSLTDELTGLNNRRSLNEALEKETHRAARYYTPLSMLMVDIDHFKHFNDQFGHHIGDHVLIDVAQALQKRCRSSDFCARYGGEEFVVLLPHTSLKDAQKLALQYCTDISTLNIKDKAITISIGISEFDPLMSAADLFEAADQALLQAKNSGRNCIACG